MDDYYRHAVIVPVVNSIYFYTIIAIEYSESINNAINAIYLKHTIIASTNKWLPRLRAAYVFWASSKQFTVDQ
ncbi:Uncharacterised protein [Enterobacter ludwigii]|nr:Uncharacterised protein [Enterobacter ludwigii]SAH30028.1 Uncharacterised protein [Enterobacter ludwigii]